jgi:hypothetical protein
MVSPKPLQINQLLTVPISVLTVDCATRLRDQNPSITHVKLRVLQRDDPRGNKPSRSWKLKILDLDEQIILSSITINKHLIRSSDEDDSKENTDSTNMIDNEEEDEKSPPDIREVSSEYETTDDEYETDEEEDPHGAEAEQTDPSLTCNGLEWKVLDQPLIDLRNNDMKTHLLWERMELSQLGLGASSLAQSCNQVSTRLPIHYFLLSFPIAYVAMIVHLTNAAFPETQLTASSFFKFIALLYAMSLNPGLSRREYWEENANKLIPGHNFGRWMGIKKFETIAQTIVWSCGRIGDALGYVRGFFDAFNQRRKAIISPCARILCDESMSGNKTIVTTKNGYVNGLPCQKKIKRKPVSTGVEIRNAADADSRILLQLEIQEEKESMDSKPFIAETNNKPHTAAVLRLVQPWFGTFRTIYGDSAFASVNTAMKCWEYGLYFIGLVKTAYSEFPKGFFSQKSSSMQPGDSIHLQATKNDRSLIAVGWKDKVLKTFIATAGSSAPGKPRIKERRHRVTKEKISVSVATTSIGSEYFTNAPAIDIHNHYRQGILEMERNIRTRAWDDKLAFTLLGMIMVDAYLMYILDHPNEKQSYRLMDFVNDVAYYLLENDIMAEQSPVIDPELPKVPCHSVPFSKIEDRGNRKRKSFCRSCTVCHEGTAMACGACKVAVCGPLAKRARPCMSVHQSQTRTE